MTDYRDHWQTASETDHLQAFMFQCFRFYHPRAVVDSEVLEVWREDVGHLSRDELRAAWKEYRRQQADSTPRIPSPNQLSAIHYRLTNKAEENKPPPPRFVSSYGKLHPCVHHALTGEGAESLTERPEYQYAEAARLRWMEDGGPDLTVLENTQRNYALARKIYDEER